MVAKIMYSRGSKTGFRPGDEIYERDSEGRIHAAVVLSVDEVGHIGTLTEIAVDEAGNIVRSPNGEPISLSNRQPYPPRELACILAQGFSADGNKYEVTLRFPSGEVRTYSYDAAIAKAIEETIG